MSDLGAFDSMGNPYHTTEHYFRRVLNGDQRTVRNRLVQALEKLGYDILDDDETTVRGRRGARGWGTSWSSADVLDYPMTLVIRLKAQTEHTTRATFDYLVKHPMLSNGEKEILTREAETLAALASFRSQESVCRVCGTESTDDSRFCRKCGSKLSFEVSEIETLRMSAEIRAGHTSIVSTFIASAASFALVGGVLIWLAAAGIAVSEGLVALLVIALVGMLLSAIFTGFGWNRINRALKRPVEKDTVLPDFEQVQLPQAPARTLASQPASVTERTTNLLSVDPAKTGEFAMEERDRIN